LLRGQKVQQIRWELIVDVSPCKTLLDQLSSKLKVMLDDNIRSFISHNLADLGATVLPQSAAVAAIRETKSEAEINILRAVFRFFMWLMAG